MQAVPFRPCIQHNSHVTAALQETTSSAPIYETFLSFLWPPPTEHLVHIIERNRVIVYLSFSATVTAWGHKILQPECKRVRIFGMHQRIPLYARLNRPVQRDPASVHPQLHPACQALMPSREQVPRPKSNQCST